MIEFKEERQEFPEIIIRDNVTKQLLGWLQANSAGKYLFQPVSTHIFTQDEMTRITGHMIKLNNQ